MVNCAFPTCTVSQTKKYAGVSLFKLPTRKSEFYTAWRKNLLDLLSKYRDMDSSFKKDVMDCKRELFICERHYAEEDIEFTKTGMKTPCLQALPTKNFPCKSHEGVPKVERKLPTRVMTNQNPSEDDFFAYKSFDELCKRVQRWGLTNNEWSIVCDNNNLKLKLIVHPYIVPYLELFVDEHFKYTIIVFGWLLPRNHQLYLHYSRSARNVTVPDLIRQIKGHKLCPGLPLQTKEGNKVISHIIPCYIDFNIQQSCPISTKKFVRHEDCIILCTTDDRCSKCESAIKRIDNKKLNVKPLHPNTPLSTLSPDRVIETLKLERKENKALRKKLEKEIHLKSQCR